MANFNRIITGQDVVTRVTKSLGLPTPTDAAGSQDATARQMWSLLTEVGQSLLTECDWNFFEKTFTINTIPGTTEYSLPEDFQAFIDSTGWNNTSRVPLIGPLTSQQWRLLQARQLGGTTLRMQYVIEQDKVVFYWVPDDPQVVTINYIGRGWVRDESNPAIYKDTVQNSGDFILYDPRLIVTALKRAWRVAKGFDITEEEQQFQKALSDAKYNNRPKNDLSLVNRGGFPYLGPLNMPDTNYGT